MTDSVTSEDFTLDRLDQEVDGITALSDQLEQLSGTMMAIEQFGFNPATHGVLKAAGLFRDTALEDVALEGFTFDDPTGPQSTLALETLHEKLNDTAGRWSAKIVSLFHKASDHINAIVNPILTKVTAATNRLTKQSWDLTKATGRTIKAHPFATILIVLSAITAAIGIIAFAGQGFGSIGSSKPMAQKFVSTLRDKINGIRFPFGKATASLEPIRGDDTPLKLVVNWTKADAYGAMDVISPVEASHIEKYGWSRGASTILDRQLTSIKHAVGSAVHGLSQGIGKVAASVGSAAGRAVVSGANRYVGFAFKTLPGAVSGAVRASGGSEFQSSMAGAGTTGVAISITYLMFVFALAAVVRLVSNVIGMGLRLIQRSVVAVASLFTGHPAEV